MSLRISGERRRLLAKNDCDGVGAIFSDVHDQSMLKIHQSYGFRSPPPSAGRYSEIAGVDYASEPETTAARRAAFAAIEYGDGGGSGNRSDNEYRARPTSALNESGGGRHLAPLTIAKPTSVTSARGGAPIASVAAAATSSRVAQQQAGAFYDPYYSDASSTAGPRSGSATPTIDRETRQRVETMERQMQVFFSTTDGFE